MIENRHDNEISQECVCLFSPSSLFFIFVRNKI